MCRMPDVVLILASMGLLFLSAEGVVRGSTRVAAALGIRPLVVGLTVVALGTSTPEMIVSLVAAAGGRFEISLGNIVGSNIANIGLIIGLAALARPMPASRPLLRRDLPLLVGTMLAYLLMARGGRIHRWEGAVLFLGIVGFCTLLTRQAMAQSRSQNDRMSGPRLPHPAGAIAGNGILLVAGLGGLVAAGHILVTSATSLARALGMSEWAIGVTLVAFGTSVPEIATSIVAALRGQPDLALGNAVGSNIFNVLLVQGTVATLFQPFTVDPALLGLEFPLMLGFSLFLALILYHRPVVHRWHGTLLLIAYLAFIAFKVA